ncbi:MAG: 16S rRNA (cytosine(1402)-N(4))-methyltransferase RsmH [Elusimicrobiota bacterium]|nr:16S rRNA (cytosine(1402)-N(4))-methyltransferase RsmH [Elusimicrobiota bacterium]
MSVWRHEPILAERIADELLLNNDGVYLDATLGLGGHSGFFLKRLSAAARVIGLDKDVSAVNMALKNISDARLTAFVCSYLEAPKIMERLNISSFDGAVFDLGLSSYQLDDASRGFSFLREGPLDMRFNNNEGISAADIINEWPADKIEEILLKYGEELYANKIALAVYGARRARKIKTTRQLAEIIEKICPHAGKIHPSTKTFQALRIAVNNELAEVELLARMLPKILLPKARAAVLTFHSLEDRIIKRAFKELVSSDDWRLVNKKVIEPSREEIISNHRARSAKLRIIERKI